MLHFLAFSLNLQRLSIGDGPDQEKDWFSLLFYYFFFFSALEATKRKHVFFFSPTRKVHFCCSPEKEGKILGNVWEKSFFIDAAAAVAAVPSTAILF